MKTKLEELMEQATPLPWPVDWTEPENPEGTTVAESHANDRLKRHSANMLPKLVKALEGMIDRVPYVDSASNQAWSRSANNLMAIRKAEQVIEEANNPKT